jgi:hypothetical protein
LVYSGRTNSQTAGLVAWLAALLFAIHPLNVESVAWISASKILLYSFFVLLALLSYLQYVHTGRIRNYVLSFVLFVFSCGSKEQAVVFPALLILLDWLLKRNLRSIEVWMEKLPFFLFSLFVGIYTLSQQNPAFVQQRAGYPLWQRLVFACYACVEYLIKLAVPIRLMYLYPYPMPPGELLPLRFFIYPIIAVIAAATVLFYRKQWLLVFGILFFLINIGLTLNVIPMSRYAVVADRYVYLPSIGVFMMMVWYSVKYVRTLPKKWRKWCLVPALAYVLCLGGYAHIRTYVWYDSKSLKKELKELLEL